VEVTIDERPREATHLIVDILFIDMEAHGAFTVRLSARWRENGDQRVLGIADITPYPPDQTGVYLVQPPSELDALIAAPPKELRFVLELVPIADRALPSGLRVSLAAPRWAPP